LSWSETLEWAEMLGLALPEVLYQGLWSEAKMRNLAESLNLEQCEGFVVRKIAQFHYQGFAQNIAKWVRSNHVQTDEHWMYQEVVPNLLQK
jgi:hypothetical protein